MLTLGLEKKLPANIFRKFGQSHQKLIVVSYYQQRTKYFLQIFFTVICFVLLNQIISFVLILNLNYLYCLYLSYVFLFLLNSLL